HRAGDDRTDQKIQGDHLGVNGQAGGNIMAATETLGSLILWLISLAIVVAIAVYLLRWLYRRSTKETAFVRTGFGGEKVVINGGAFVIPVLHEVTPVNMNVMRIEVRRGQTTAPITPDPTRHGPLTGILPPRPPAS